MKNNFEKFLREFARKTVTADDVFQKYNIGVDYPNVIYIVEKTERSVFWYCSKTKGIRVRHRLDGPAVRHYSIFNTVSGQYWVYNYRMTYNDFLIYKERRDERKRNN